jgi:topoisomerase-4 subunit A
LRCKWEKEQLARGQWRVIINELPHGVSVKQVMEEIEALANPKAQGNRKEVSQEQRRMKQFILDQVEGVRDESDRKSKLRLVIEPRSSRQDPEELMAALMVHTSLETRYAVNLTWLGLDGLPETKGIVEILTEWGKFRIDTVRRRTQFRLARVQERHEVVMGRLLAYVKIDEIIKLIRASEDQPQAKENLQKKYKFTERQAQDIVDLRLGQLTKLDGIKLNDERKALEAERKGLKEILDDEKALKKVVVDQLNQDSKNLRRRAPHADQDRRARAGRAHRGRGAGHGDPVAQGLDPRAHRPRPGRHAAQLQGRRRASAHARMQDHRSGHGARQLRQELYRASRRHSLGTRRRRARQHAGQLRLGRHRVDGRGRSAAAPADEQLGGPRLPLQARRPRHQDAPGQGLHEGGRGASAQPPAVVGNQTFVAALSSDARLLVFPMEEIPERPNGGVGVQLIAIPEKEKLAAVAATDGKTLVVSGVKRKNRASETLDAKQLAEHIGKRAQRGRVCDVGFRPDRLEVAA